MDQDSINLTCGCQIKVQDGRLALSRCVRQQSNTRQRTDFKFLFEGLDEVVTFTVSLLFIYLFIYSFIYLFFACLFVYLFIYLRGNRTNKLVTNTFVTTLFVPFCIHMSLKCFRTIFNNKP